MHKCHKGRGIYTPWVSGVTTPQGCCCSLISCGQHVALWCSWHVAWCGRHVAWCSQHIAWCGQHVVWCGQHIAWYGWHIDWCSQQVAWCSRHIAWCGQHVGHKGRAIYTPWASGVWSPGCCCSLTSPGQHVAQARCSWHILQCSHTTGTKSVENSTFFMPRVPWVPWSLHDCLVGLDS